MAKDDYLDNKFNDRRRDICEDDALKILDAVYDNEWYKNKPDDKIWWLDNRETIGEWVFSFDKEKEFNMFRDYPHALTAEQKKIFDQENPYWKNYFMDRE